MSNKKAYNNLQKNNCVDTLKAILEVAMLHATPELTDGHFQEINVAVEDLQISLSLGHGATMDLIAHEISHIFKEGEKTRVRIECDNFSYVDFVHHKDGKIAMEIQGEGCLVLEMPDVKPFL